MFNLLFDNTSLPIMQQVLAFSEHRQDVLARNVANINTPGFRQTDLPVDEFLGALSDAIENRESNSPHRFLMRSTSNIKFGGSMEVTARPVEGFMNYYDGSDRSVEHLQNEMLKNALWHEAAAKLFSQQSAQLETAIRGRLR